MIKIKKFDDLTGQRFGRLVVLSAGEPYLEKTTNTTSGYTKRRTWDCMCDCGNIKKNVLEKCLKRKLVTSCGCLKKQRLLENAVPFERKYNKYDLTTNEYGIGYDSNGREFYFDLEDYDKIKDYCWCVKNNLYVESTSSNRLCVSMHRLVMGNPNYHVDHINHKPNDNRKCNLRIVTVAQNQANTKTRKDNTSGTKGVCWSKTHGRWVATLQINKKKYVKNFLNKEDAINYRKFLEEKYQKEYSYDRSIKGGN